MMMSISRPPGISIHNGRFRSLMFRRRTGFLEGPWLPTVPVPALAVLPASWASAKVPDRVSCLSGTGPATVLISLNESVDMVVTA